MKFYVVIDLFMMGLALFNFVISDDSILLKTLNAVLFLLWGMIFLYDIGLY